MAQARLVRADRQAAKWASNYGQCPSTDVPSNPGHPDLSHSPPPDVAGDVPAARLLVAGRPLLLHRRRQAVCGDEHICCRMLLKVGPRVVQPHSVCGSERGESVVRGWDGTCWWLIAKGPGGHRVSKDRFRAVPCGVVQQHQIRRPHPVLSSVQHSTARHHHKMDPSKGPHLHR